VLGVLVAPIEDVSMAGRVTVFLFAFTIVVGGVGAGV
jgi:hypothetical protein